MIKVESDNAAIEKNLRFMEKALQDHGGGIDPDLVIRSENGSMSVEKHGPSRKKPLIVLPAELLLPTAKLGIKVKGDEILIDPDKEGLTDIQVKLAEAMFEIYNLTNKIALHKRIHPWFYFRKAPQYMERLLQSRSPNDRQQKMLASLSSAPAEGPEFDEMVCESFIHTRTLGHKEADPNTSQPVLTTNIMPIVDFINHHFEGASFSFDKGYLKEQPEREFMVFHESRPILTSNECFAFYTQIDTLDAFISYGFPDTSAPIVRSVPVELEFEKAGKLIINSYMSSWKKGKLHKNVAGLRPYIPITMKKEQGLLEVTHMIIPCASHAQHALRRVLRMMISNLTPRGLTADEIWNNVLQAEDKILSANIDFYRKMIDELEGDSNDNDPATDAGKCKRQAIDIARIQLTKLYKYQYAGDRTDTGANQDTNELAMAAAE